MNIGNAIKLIRTARKTRQGDLAAAIGVSQNYLSMLEAGKRNPSLAVLKKIADHLNVPAGLFLLWGEGAGKKLRKSQLKQLRELLVRIQTIFLEAEADDAAKHSAAWG